MHTFLFFDDGFPMIFHVPIGDFCLLPEWENRVKEMKEYKVINKHGKEIKT